MFRLAQKTCFLEKLFTIVLALTFNPILRPALVNQILLNKKGVLFWSFSLPILKYMRAK
jgi:hypothetical protein